MTATAVVAALVVLLGGASPLLAQSPGSDAATESAELVELRAQADAVTCPRIAGLVTTDVAPTVSASTVDGVEIPGGSITLACSFAVQDRPELRPFTARLVVRWVGASEGVCDDNAVREVADGRQTVRGVRPRDALAAVLDYQFPVEVSAAVPDVVAQLDAGFAAMADQAEPFAAVCQFAPVPVTCPPIAGAEAGEPDGPRRTSLLQADCWYTPDEGGYVQLQVVWATARSEAGARRAACIDPGEPVRERTGVIAHDTAAVRARWLTTSEPITPDTMRTAAQALIDQVVEQARPCEGVRVEPLFAPLPAYLADEFDVERIGTAAFATPEQAATAVTAIRGSETDPTPTTAPAPTTTVAPAPTTTSAPSTTTALPAQAVADEVGSGGAAGEEPATTASSERAGWQSVALRVVSIVALVLSLLGVALALFLMRREARVRVWLDVVRLVIVLVVAVVSVVVFAAGAPAWAIVAAVVVGGALGVVQGRHLAIRLVDRRAYASRATWGLVAFATALVVTQIAGWLNRSGAIAVGIALSFLSAALTAGVLVGRHPRLAAARLGHATAVALVVLVGLGLAAAPSGTGFGQSPAAPPPTDDTDAPPSSDDEAAPTGPVACGGLERRAVRCPQHEALIDLVDWTRVSFNGGLLASSGKPPVVITVPRGLSEPPDAITRTVEWTEGEDAAPSTVTETFTFDVDEDGLCCSVFYEGAATQRSGAEGDGTEWVASGRLSDIKTIGESTTGAFESIGNVVQGVPFGERTELTWGAGGETPCGRYVAETVPLSRQNATFDTLMRDGESLADDDRQVQSVGLARMTIPCDVPGFGIEEALAAAPPPPRGAQRSSPCPTRQEWVAALGEGGLPITANTTIGDVFISPNEPVCSDGSFSAPTAYGDGRKGGTRSEFNFELGPPDEVGAWGDDSALYEVGGISSVGPRERCPVGDDGRPMPDPGRATCEYRSAHRVGDDGWLSIDYDQQYADGPNITIRASLPWGSYYYRCHHCELDDPEVERFLGALHDFAGGWPDALAAEGYGLAADGEIVDPSAVTTTVPAPSATPETDALAEQAEQLGIDPELAELFVDDLPTEGSDDGDEAGAAALAALVGLMGSLGLAGTALAESGMSASELAQTFRRGGLDGLGDELDARARADAASVVIDEYGDELRPDEDGTYEWDDGDSTRRVDRAELEELIARARQAQLDLAADETERLAEHERFREQTWAKLRNRVRTEAIEAADARELADVEQRLRLRRGERLRDALEGLEDSPLRDRMLDLLERESAPGDEDFWGLREIMRQQESDQRLIDAMGDRSEIAMALDGMQEDMARLAEAAGQPGLATAIRNPEVPARLATAYATGGLSEIALAPIDLWNTLHDRADAVMASENRDLTTGEIVQEVAWAVAVEYVGSRVLGGGDVDVPTGPKRPMELLPTNYIEQVKPGQKIPLLHQTGYTPEHITRLTNFAERHGVVPGARTANQYSAAHIAAGRALPKPLDIKPKTINELDLHLGARADHLGTVGFFQPKMPDTSAMSPRLREQIEERFAARLKEQRNYLDEIRANPTLKIEGGRILDAQTGKAFAGDMDLVYLRDAETGELITGERYRALRDEMLRDGLIEHGAEFNLHADLSEGLPKGTWAHDQAMKQADHVASKVLMPTHDDGALIMEIRNGVAVRGEPVFMLPVTPG